MKFLPLITLLSVQLVYAENRIETTYITGHREDQAAEQLIGSIELIDGNSLQEIGHTHINEALTRVPGTWISRGNGQEHLTAIRSPMLTGAGSCGSFQFAEDNIPIRATGFCNVNQLFEVNTEQAAGIEVWRGPGSVFYGSNALHGIVNVKSAAPGEPGYFSLESGSHNYHRAKLSLGGGSHQHRYQLSINGAHDGGYKDDSGFDQQKLTAKHQFLADNVSATSTLSLSNLNQETAGFLLGKGSYKDTDLMDSNPNPEAFRDAKSIRAATRLEWVNLLGGTLAITPYARHSEMQFLQHYLPGQAQENNRHTSLGVQSSFRRMLDESTQVWLGADLELAQGSLLERQDNPTDHPSAFLRATIPAGVHYDYKVESQLAALFTNLTHQLTESLQLEAGLRYEHLSYDYDNRMLDGDSQDDGSPCLLFGNPVGCRFSRPADRTDSFNNLSYQLGGLWTPTDSLTVYLRASEAYRAPQATELYRLQKGQQRTDLDVEQLQSLELGLRRQWYSLNYEVAFYHMRKEDVIFRDVNGFTVSGGKTRHKGVELSLYQPLSDTWHYRASASWSEHQYDNNPLLVAEPISGNDIDTAPNWIANAQLGWSPDETFRAELEWIYLGEYYLDPQNRHQYPGHNLFNLRLHKQLSGELKAWQLSARITNLFDKRYAERADFAFGSYRYFTGEPRGFYIELRREFN